MSSRAHSTETTHSVHEVDKYGCTGLHYCAYNGEVPHLTTLIESGANVNARDNHGWTPLHYAALKGESNVGPESNAENKSEIHISARYIERNKFVGKYAQLEKQVLRVMLSLLCCLCRRWWRGYESHMSQCYYDIITLLVNSGASVNIKNNEGLTALHLSALLGCPKIVRMLINHGCEIDTVDNKGHTPLHLAQRNGQENVVDILINSGSSVNIKDIDGRTLLHWSSLHGWYEIVRMLINSGVETDPVDHTGRTPLQLAKKKKNVDIVNLLREAKPFQHGDSQLYRIKERVKMFFGFSRTVKREERGAVGGRNIQSCDINTKILDNTDNDEEFEMVEPESGSTAASMPANSDPAETMVSCVQQLIRDHPSTVGQTSYSSTRVVDNLDNKLVLHVYNVNLNPTSTTNVHKAGTFAVSSNIRYVKRRKTKKRKDENDSESESDRKSLDSDDTESGTSGL